MNNQYCEAKTLYDIDTLVFMWRESTCDMQECDYIASIGLLCEMLNKARPSKLLINYSSYSYMLSTELLAWTADTLFKRMRSLGIDTLSITEPQSEAVKSNIHPLFHDDHVRGISVMSFGQMEASIEWLLSKKSSKVKKKSLFI